MKKYLVIFALLLAGMVKAQQQEHYSMYLMNNYLINPAEGGSEEFIDVKLGYRTQWLGLEGAPKTLFASGHAPVHKRTSRFEDVPQMAFHGAGGMVTSDAIGPYNIISVKGSYSYHMPVTKSLMLSFGTFLGIKQYKFDLEGATFDKDPTLKDNAGVANQKTVPDASLGVWGYSKKYYFGLSSFQILKNDLKLSNVNGSSVKGGLDRHFYITAGYRFPIGEKFGLIPSFLIKKVAPAPYSVDINAKFRYMDLAWVGASYRNADAIVGMAGVTFKRIIDIGYAFDFTTSKLQNFNNGTHEIMLGLRLPNHQHKPAPAQFW